MKPKLSICIPTYSRKAFLCKALESVISQISDILNPEIVISDNASTDETKAVVEKLQIVYPQIKYFRNERNIGFDGNVVKCIERASGEYIFFLSDDDIVLPGTLKRIKDIIDSHDPAIICLSHYAFEGDNPLIKSRVFLPEVDRVFENGREYFLFSHLGFLSSIVIKTDYARQFLNFVRNGKGCAHLDIASRVALTMKGPFVFLGTAPIAARSPEKEPQGYNLMLYGFIYVNQLYRELQKEGLLSEEIVSKRERSLLTSLIPRYVLNQIAVGDFVRMYNQRVLIRKELGHHLQFYIYVYPLFFIPRLVMILPYKVIRGAIRFVRRYRYN